MDVSRFEFAIFSAQLIEMDYCPKIILNENCNLLRVFVALACFWVLAIGGCSRSPSVEKPVAEDRGKFEIFWPPRDFNNEANDSIKPLLLGELSIVEFKVNDYISMGLNITLQRPSSESDRIRWNKNLAFPEYSWMAKVRVWDRGDKWLWPNLSYLLTAHGAERIERYGGVDPGKGIDNDFAAVLIRSIDDQPTTSEMSGRFRDSSPLVSAQWYSVEEAKSKRNSIVHVARSDQFKIRFLPTKNQARSGRLGIWLIYADFLNADLPRTWPKEKEYAGGILAYLEVKWSHDADDGLEFEIENLVPKKATGLDWAKWSSSPAALEKSLTMTYEANSQK